MKSVGSVLCVVLGVFIVSAQTINISGIVKSGTDPVEGATILLASAPELFAVSDANGAFTLSDVGIRTRFYPSNRSSFARFSGNRLIIRSELPQIISLTLFNGLGRQLHKASINSAAGTDAATVRFPECAAGLYFLEIIAGEQRMILPRMFPATPNLIVECTNQQPSPNSRLAKISASGDMLLGMKTRYLLGSTQITSSTAADVEIVLEASTQFQASGTLEHTGQMVKINAKGCNFSMGQPVPIPVESDDDLWEYEYPVHTVAFTYDFLMDTTEITQQNFDSVMSEVYGETYDQPSWSPNFGLGDFIPGYHINQSDAILFCNARSKLEDLDTVYTYTSITGKPGGLCELSGVVVDCSKNGYRLPTEAEWEYACRGGTVTDYYWNKNYRPYPADAVDSTEIGEYAIWHGNSARMGNESPQFGIRVGCATKKPNQYGLYDITGSVGEWVHIAPNYTAEALTDPKPEGSIDVKNEVIDRGGNWGNAPVYLRSGCRPSYQYDYAYNFFGLRTVKEIR
ncbi:MAG: SUMF1/EgtB/PvdO family nonheme iron enzyme [Chitinispirillaceae bacterium]|nr:SUMF1/EgtB/PvdO family nonheme iron enzyme [Chitinispirillaceae bacterium]